ncbi:enolase C-terminal domain-like protein [Octadecabacter antarcticus]|uniref:enolase C-terminal domain-like protein n=1 Tax=Octadecabacter antarcticus TaxID=1217908 RepID=UPI00018063D4|nr:enolase C-terminal domain-like protein [Octadecabacter antarcticus]
MADDPAPYAGRDSFTFVHVRVRDSDGMVGDGFTGRFLAPEVASFLNRVGGEINGQEGDAIAAAMRRFNPRGMTGVVVSALGALEIALVDLCGRRTGIAAWRMLGGKRDNAPVHVTCGFPALDNGALVAACAAEVAAGAGGIKVLVGAQGRTLGEDVARLTLVREAVGEGIDLIADANCAWSRETAQDMVRAVDGLYLSWLEEPVRNNDAADLAALVVMGGVPIGAGQMEQSNNRFDQLIGAGVSMIQPNAVFTGGFNAAINAAQRAIAANLQVSPAGGWDAINLHWMCGAMNNGAVELHRAQARISRLLRPSHVLRNGRLWMSDAAGLGLNLDDKELARCRVG